VDGGAAPSSERKRPRRLYLRHLIDCQAKCLQSKANRCRWHPAVLQWCADVWRRDRGAYEMMAFGDMMILPHPDTVRKHSSTLIARMGHDDALYQSLGPALDRLFPDTKKRKDASIDEAVRDSLATHALVFQITCTTWSTRRSRG